MNKDERRAWLQSRQSAVTATDIRRLVIPYESDPEPQAALIYDEKTMDVDDRPGTPLMEMGLATEDHNAMLYSRRTMMEVIKPPLFAVHRLVTWCGASLDRQRAIDLRNVELKYTGPFFSDEWGREGTDAVPAGYLIQTNWQMFCTESKITDVSALCGSGAHRIYCTNYSDELQEVLFEIAETFWGFVERRQRPDRNWIHPKAQALAERVIEAQAGKTVTIADPYAEYKAREYLRFREIEGEAHKKAEDTKRELIIRYMGDAETANVGEYRLSREPYARFVKRRFVPASKRKKTRFFV